MEQILTVSQVNGVIKTLLETNAILKRLTVSGEVCDFRRQISGHLYFSLKDENGRIRCVMFKNAASGLSFDLENGMKVVITGSISVYEPTGQVQILVRTMKPSGLGDLYQQFEALKQKLKTMGWFESEAKKPLPEVICRVGIVTSPSGAAIRDMISVIHRRDPSVQIVICPAQVQGEGAAASIAAGIQRLCDYGQLDVIIIGRGGGSMEELSCFNDFLVAQAIHDAEIPIISAVGHETDFTISDFTADFRAPTPSVAGELVTGDRQVVLKQLQVQREQLIRLMNEGFKTEHTILENQCRQLLLSGPARQIERAQMDLDRLSDRLTVGVNHWIKEESAAVSLLKQQLGSNDPKAPLDKGYALVQNQEGRVVTSGGDLDEGMALKLIFAHDHANVVVQKQEGERQ